MIKKPVDNEEKSLPRLVETSDIQFNLITELAKDKVSVKRCFLDNEAKILTIYFVDTVEKMDTVVHYLTDHFALIYETGNMQFIGIQIETI
jgi:hypothetical protein